MSHSRTLPKALSLILSLCPTCPKHDFLSVCVCVAHVEVEKDEEKFDSA
jgi:hypothetical protein